MESFCSNGLLRFVMKETTMRSSFPFYIATNPHISRRYEQPPSLPEKNLPRMESANGCAMEVRITRFGATLACIADHHI